MAIEDGRILIPLGIMHTNYRNIVMFETAIINPLEEIPFDKAYKFFGLKPGASAGEVKKKYYKLAMQYHPDQAVAMGMDPTKSMEMTQKINYYDDLLRGSDYEEYRKAYKEGGKGAVDALKKADHKPPPATHFPQAVDPFSFGPAVDIFTDPFSFAGKALYRRRGDLFQFDPNSTQNEGRWRLKDPKHFTKYFRVKSKTPGITYVMGHNRKTKKVEVQAIRFNKKIMNERKAAQWWRRNKDRFRKEWVWPRRYK